MEGKNEKKYNLGIALLRIWMCFEVVLCHQYSWNGSGTLFKLLQEYSSVAVPVFMILAFLFTDIEKISGDMSKCKNRVVRLLVPHVFWVVAYFVIYWLLDMSFGYTLDLHHGIKGLIAALLTGNALNTAMWFQVDLIIITVLFILCYRLFGKKADHILGIVSAVCICAEYLGIWYNVVSRFLYGNVFYWTVGRLVEMIPMAFVGIMLCRTGAFTRTFWDDRVKRALSLGICFLSIIVFVYFFKLPAPSEDFMYGGLHRIVLALITVCLFFFLIAFEVPKAVKNVIVFVSKYTMGVYFIHNMIGTILFNTGIGERIGLTRGMMPGCIVIFFVSLIIAAAIGKLPLKVAKMAVS